MALIKTKKEIDFSEKYETDSFVTFRIKTSQLTQLRKQASAESRTVSNFIKTKLFQNENN
jgi:hypothetical protein